MIVEFRDILVAIINKQLKKDGSDPLRKKLVQVGFLTIEKMLMNYQGRVGGAEIVKAILEAKLTDAELQKTAKSIMSKMNDETVII